MRFESVRKVNAFFREATRADVDALRSRIVLSERQEKVFEMFYIKRHNVGFIADTLYLSIDTINKELFRIRSKILQAI